MIYDEITKRDWYMFRRGEMSEYIRNHGILAPEIYHQLYEWIDKGHRVYDNPWGVQDAKNGIPCDYLTALEILKSSN